MVELTTRESRVADLAAIGFRNAQIADRLGITSTVVRFDLSEIYRKLRVASRAELSEARARAAGSTIVLLLTGPVRARASKHCIGSRVRSGAR